MGCGRPCRSSGAGAARAARARAEAARANAKRSDARPSVDRRAPTRPPAGPAWLAARPLPGAVRRRRRCRRRWRAGLRRRRACRGRAAGLLLPGGGRRHGSVTGDGVQGFGGGARVEGGQLACCFQAEAVVDRYLARDGVQGFGGGARVEGGELACCFQAQAVVTAPSQAKVSRASAAARGSSLASCSAATRGSSASYMALSALSVPGLFRCPRQTARRLLSAAWQ